jgi:hypothetical protein
MILEQFRYVDVVDKLLQQRILLNLQTIMIRKKQTFSDYRIQYFEHIQPIGESFQLSQMAVRALQKIERYGNVAGSSMIHFMMVRTAIRSLKYWRELNNYCGFINMRI